MTEWCACKVQTRKEIGNEDLAGMEFIQAGLLPPQWMAELIGRQILPRIGAVMKLEEKIVLAGGALSWTAYCSLDIKPEGTAKNEESWREKIERKNKKRK